MPNKFHAVHYRILADALARGRAEDDQEGDPDDGFYDDAATFLADVFEADNERFDRTRFIRTCNGQIDHTRDRLDSWTGRQVDPPWYA